MTIVNIELIGLNILINNTISNYYLYFNEKNYLCRYRKFEKN